MRIYDKDTLVTLRRRKDKQYVSPVIAKILTKEICTVKYSPNTQTTPHTNIAILVLAGEHAGGTLNINAKYIKEWKVTK